MIVLPSPKMACQEKVVVVDGALNALVPIVELAPKTMKTWETRMEVRSQVPPQASPVKRPETMAVQTRTLNRRRRAVLMQE